MPNKILWDNAPVSRGNVLTTELNAVPLTGSSATGSEYDNSVNLDQYGACDVTLASLAAPAGGYIQLFMVQSLDGTNYEEGIGSGSNVYPGTHMLAATVNITSGSSAKRAMSPWFRLPPNKVKFALYNGVGVATAASGNTVSLWTSNDEVQ